MSEASEALLFFSGFRGPFSTNLFTPGGNNFRQGSFFVLCFFLSAEASEALLSRRYYFVAVAIYIATVFV